MRLKVLSIAVVMLFLVAFLVNGCIFDSTKKINNDNTEIQIPDFEDSFGGYKPTDEAPAFGDAEIATVFGEDQDVPDLLSTDPKIAQDINDSLVEVYFLRITWGRLNGDSTATLVTDWSGKAQIDKGVLVLLKKIRFELGDYIHYPRLDKQTLEWTSHTSTHFDGILVAIVVPPNDISNAEGTFTFSTTPFSRTFSYSELESIHVIFPVDQEGNEIAFVGHKRQLSLCGGGFLDGRWIRTGEDKGEFKGKWINEDGTLAGHFKGHWGIRKNGEKVFFGKYISNKGAFKGFLKGKWGYWENEGKGWFAGGWHDRNHVAKGTLKGHWRTDDLKGQKGFLDGEWKRMCP